ncbi:MAG: 30S ribosome-binding factor RbfA [Betaproteobacteria bacterium]|jgi:ribosome-binding factor A|nr:MAG: 30S ribosome-binding factor RbfA [Betaproteobacteria bacterium]
MANSERARRIEEQIRFELATICAREVRDPRVAGVSFTAVRVARDLENAQVFFTLLQGDPAQAALALARASGFIRSQLAQRMDLRIVPRLSFVYDISIERGAHLSHLIDQAVAEDRRHAEAASEAPADSAPDSAPNTAPNPE